MTDMPTPYWRLDAVEEDCRARVFNALLGFLAAGAAPGSEDHREAVLRANVLTLAAVRAYRGGPQVEEFVPDVQAFARHQATKAAFHDVLAAALPGGVAERTDMGYVEEQLAVAAERVYEPVIAALDQPVEVPVTFDLIGRLSDDGRARPVLGGEGALDTDRRPTGQEAPDAI